MATGALPTFGSSQTLVPAVTSVNTPPARRETTCNGSRPLAETTVYCQSAKHSGPRLTVSVVPAATACCDSSSRTMSCPVGRPGQATAPVGASLMSGSVSGVVFGRGEVTGKSVGSTVPDADGAGCTGFAPLHPESATASGTLSTATDTATAILDTSRSLSLLAPRTQSVNLAESVACGDQGGAGLGDPDGGDQEVVGVEGGEGEDVHPGLGEGDHQGREDAGLGQVDQAVDAEAAPRGLDHRAGRL